MSEVKYKYCPKCGNIMTANSGGWWCSNCGSFETADGKVYPANDEIKVINNLTTQPTEATFWCKFRAEAAKDILCAMVRGGYSQGRIQEQAKLAKRYADELIKQLKGDGTEV